MTAGAGNWTGPFLTPHVEKLPCANFWSNWGNQWRLTAYCNFCLMTCSFDPERHHDIYWWRNFRQQFPVQNKVINYRILIKYIRDHIAWKIFRNNVKIKRKIQISCIVLNGAWIENHLHVSSSENRSMLSTPTGYPVYSENLHKRVFQCAESKLQSDLLSDHTRHTSFTD